MTVELTPAILPQAVDDRCTLFDRVSIVLGGTALGAGVGFFITMTTGALEPRTAALYGAPVYLFALYLAYGGARDAADIGRVRAVLPALLLLAVSAWPAAILLTPLDAPPVWSMAVVSLLALTVVTESSRTHSVFRSSWLIVLTAILSAQQALQAALGS
ncbi:hypothetical protein [Terricaulis sp.]|uniref:hypothetical protein n=1 Tax=Terricaulis sp. TaxID=2768686 RepID=UPI00378410EB